MAAVLNASGPVLVSVTVLLVAAMALWLASRESMSSPTEVAGAMEVLMEEVAVHLAEPSELRGPGAGLKAIGRRPHSARIGHRTEDAGPGRDHDDEPMPF